MLGRLREKSGALGGDGHERVVRRAPRPPDAATHTETHHCTSRRDRPYSFVG